MHTYLALGDSYTIGEGVPLYQGYPYQTVQRLRTAGYDFHAPEIVARTGWTTDELAHTLTTLRLLPHYDIVTLLIGVNNQYRGRDSREYATQFDALLQRALLLTGASSRVFVLSIPDWGYSPFGAGRDKGLIAGEIDAFNTVAREASQRQKIRFLDITGHSRADGATPEGFVADGLHPSPATYRFWAQELAAVIGAGLPTRQFPVD
ncbi:SGNH/GDSL hydrolase family protein [Puia sp.]|jgi:lysophospholipase L1-like esterase|uniref:SGNH/GDSL hydrolase family protein n=1 Tax=Puia sp. TaxID=2045100 RepID=UPI002F3EDFA7